MSVKNIIVVGAGVAGLSTALFLRREGCEVTVIDALPPASGASFGNAGMISADTNVPIALPGMLAKVPGWLTDPTGPLVIRPGYAIRLAPWLLRWIRAGRLDRATQIADAMRALHLPAFACWRALLGEADYRDLVRQAGQLFVWEGKPGPTAEVEARLRSRAGVAGEVLGADDIRQLVPELSRDFAHGVLVPGNGHTANPARAVRTLGEKLRAEGGEILAERVMKLIPRAGGGFTVMTNVANHGATDVVVAGGAWSMQLLAPLGVKNIPLETERGYHAFLPEPSIAPRLPVCNKSRGFFITPMEHGLRVAGTVEFAGLDAAPDERRAEILLEHAKRMLPGLQGGKPSIWMGMRPSLPDSLPVLGPVKSRPGLWLAFGHGHFGITGGPPSGRLVASMITGQKPNIDPTPYSAERF